MVNCTTKNILCLIKNHYLPFFCRPIFRKIFNGKLNKKNKWEKFVPAGLFVIFNDPRGLVKFNRTSAADASIFNVKSPLALSPLTREYIFKHCKLEE